LHRDYAETAEATAYLRGRLDVAEQSRDTSARRDRLHCRYDELTTDVACNRLPCAVAEALVGRPDIDAGVRSAIRAAADGFADVASAPLTPAVCAAPAPDDRRSPGYGPLLDLCRLLAGGLGWGIEVGPSAGPSFLLDLEAVWERYVTAIVVGAFAHRRGRAVRVQPYLSACPPATGRPHLHLRPDVVIDADGRPHLVLDAKWKRLSRTALATDDVYQVLAYAAAIGAPRAVLVYPGGRTRRWTYPTAGPRLEVWSVKVIGSPEACERSRRRLGRGLR
jgi:5-methylcytosine-specific restriction enzyme subunit McrC